VRARSAAARLRARGLLGVQLVVQLREVVLEVVALVCRVLVELPQPVLGLPQNSGALRAVACRLHAGNGEAGNGYAGKG
jgi:hypothetical protein